MRTANFNQCIGHGQHAIPGKAIYTRSRCRRCKGALKGKPRLTADGNRGQGRRGSLSLLCVPCRANVSWQELALKYGGNAL